MHKIAVPSGVRSRPGEEQAGGSDRGGGRDYLTGEQRITSYVWFEFYTAAST
jgi:hypothetical protein